MARYNLLAPAGSRELLILDTQGAGKVLASWETQEREPQELELLIYPLFAGEPGMPPQTVTWTWGSLFLDLQLGLGAGAEASSAAYSTTGKLVFGSTVSAGPDQSNFSLPHNGVRLRFCARSARLSVNKLKSPLCIVLAASLTPIHTGGLSPCLPQLIPLGFGGTWIDEDVDTPAGSEYPRGTIIPKGARECRMLSSNPLALLAFYGPGAETAIAQIPAAELVDWRPFTGAAYSCAVRYSEPDWPSGNAAGELYEVEFR